MKFVALILFVAAQSALAQFNIDSGAGEIHSIGQGKIEIEHFNGTIEIHSDAGEVEIEGRDIHAHAQDFVHIEGEGDGTIHLETTHGYVLIESNNTHHGVHLKGKVTTSDGLGTTPNAGYTACSEVVECPAGHVVVGIDFAGCDSGEGKVKCARIGNVVESPGHSEGGHGEEGDEGDDHDEHDH